MYWSDKGHIHGFYHLSPFFATVTNTVGGWEVQEPSAGWDMGGRSSVLLHNRGALKHTDQEPGPNRSLY